MARKLLEEEDDDEEDDKSKPDVIEKVHKNDGNCEGTACSTSATMAISSDTS